MLCLLVGYHLLVVYCCVPVNSEVPHVVDVAAGGPVVLDAGVADDASAPPPPRNQEQFTLKYSKRMRSNKLKKNLTED